MYMEGFALFYPENGSQLHKNKNTRKNASLLNQ